MISATSECTSPTGTDAGRVIADAVIGVRVEKVDEDEDDNDEENEDAREFSTDVETKESRSGGDEGLETENDNNLEDGSSIEP